MLSIGQLLQERYQIVAKLGEGGMGAVYRAFDTRLNVPCVVKEMLNTPAAVFNAAAAAEQFKREAGMLAMLRHTNLPRVGDYFIDQNNYYLVMDYIEGLDLRKLIGENGLPEATVLHYAAQLLDVLEYIHGEGVVHRDIKPANIIIQNSGRVVLVDFGLAKMQIVGGGMTKTFLRGAGTPEYAPPEQMKGGTDQRSDLYSLGATLYEALTGKSPADATDRASGVELTSIRKLSPNVSARTERVVQKAMLMNREMRYPTAAAMRADLGAVGKAISKPPVKVAQPPAAAAPPSGTAVIRAPADARRRTMQIGAAISIVVLIVVAAIALPSMLSSNSSAGIVTTPKATSTTMPTRETVATSAPTHTSIPATQPPQDTVTPQPTPLKVIATTTLYPSATTVATATPAPTDTPAPPTNTPRPSPTPAPNASPVAPGMLYPAPVLVSPASETVFAAQDTPRLSWSASKALGADDFYFVEIGHAQGSDPYYVKDTSVTPRDYLPGLSVNGRLTWRVSVVRKSGESYTVISPVSATWVFIWQTAQSNPGNPGPGATPTLVPP